MSVAGEPVAVACGITGITRSVNPRDASRMHGDPAECPGSRAQFHRHSAGRHPVAPQKQAQAAAVSPKYGHGDMPVFVPTRHESCFPAA